MAINTFDTANSTLQAGVNLIEASAGTGKTYAIAMLVLRFVVEQGLEIEKLLVVTFTKAATEELKDRIRSRLAEARQILLNQSPDQADQDLKRWLDSLPLESKTIRQRLDQALLNIDQAAIFTIHGFCQRVLSEHALESGQMFDCELSSDIAAIRQNCADDFWRKLLYSRPSWQAALLTAIFPAPDLLLSSIGNIGPQQTVYPDDYDLDTALNNIKALTAIAAEQLQPVLHKLAQAFQDGLFNESFTRDFAEKSAALNTWLDQPDSGIADFSWLCTAGLQAGLNGRKFLVSKSKPLPSDQQKQCYLNGLGIDCSVFDQLAAALQYLQVVLRRALLQSLRNEMEPALQKNNLLSFSELISRVDQALCGDKSQFLLGELQQRFGVALIDEFQDTDHQQWRIFSTIFAAPSQYLYLIGDPKQAIYKFRGADIYSYFAAQQQAEHHYTLLENWRSHPDLVSGVNRLFERNKPFIFDKLNFNPVHAARSEADGRIGDTPPLAIWQLDKNQGKIEHWTSGKAAMAIRSAVVAEILQLLNQPAQLIDKDGERPLLPKDIAILVRSNNQAADYQQALNSVGIPCVLNSKQSVFATLQALEMHTVLQAIAQPGHIPALKQALTVSWFNLDGQQLYRLSHDETGLDSWLNRFQEYYQLWLQQGLLCMLHRLLEQEQAAEHLCGQPQAERALTNLQHIAERLQEAAIEDHLSINKTLDWLRRAIRQSARDSSDDRQLRLESDEDAVKIVTLHSSKGLEYPLVFCPGLWQRSYRLKNEQFLIQCHENGEMIADFGSSEFSQRREQAVSEELAEDLRLFYVAVTRAKYRCYLAWADVRSKDRANDSAMAYLLNFAEADFSGQQHMLTALAVELPQAFEYRLIPTDREIAGDYRRSTSKPVLTCRERRRSLLTHWQMSSYTALSALSLHIAPELPEDKATEPLDIEMPGEPVLTSGQQGLPKGAQTGNVIHSLLETLSFQRLAHADGIKAIRDQALRRWGLQIENPLLIDCMLQTIVQAPLSSADPDFCLKNLSDEHCLKEMPFYLSMQNMDAADINRILAASQAFQPLSAREMSGYLTGFIDLICAYRGKYYVMDYKTNSLPDYRPDSLLQAMREHNYGLQYWLYSLVLDSYLRQRLPDYRYARHFGGVKYLFVRGMSMDKPGMGVYADLPDQALLRALGALFFK